MEKINFEEDRCKACQICLTACPQNILKMADRLNSKGFNPVIITDMNKCTSCGLCAMVCPDLVIKVYK